MGSFRTRPFMGRKLLFLIIKKTDLDIEYSWMKGRYVIHVTGIP